MGFEGDMVIMMVIGQDEEEVEQGVGGDVKIQGGPCQYRRVDCDQKAPCGFDWQLNSY